MFLFCVFVLLSLGLVADSQVVSSQAEPVCCITPSHVECSCITGWICDPTKVVSGFCSRDSCFQNCKITNWLLGLFIAAACVVIIIFIILLLVCCRAKRRRE